MIKYDGAVAKLQLCLFLEADGNFEIPNWHLKEKSQEE